MAKYGLQPGVRGSEARHVSAAQYYRDLKRWTGELEADNHTLQNEIAARDENIELLQEQMQCQQEEYHRQLMEIQAKHRKEVSLLKTVISKAAAWFPYFRKMLHMENFCLKIGFNDRQVATLISGKPLEYAGKLYSEEHKRKFKTERATFHVVKDNTKLVLCMEGKPIGEWFREQLDKLFSSVRRTITPPRKSKRMGL